MPNLRPEAPDLVASPDGKWAVERLADELRLYALDSPIDQMTRCESKETLRKDAGPGRVFFVQNDRLVSLTVQAGEGAEEKSEQGPKAVLAELLEVPSFRRIGRGIRIPGAARILGGGAAGIVVAPSGAGAELLVPRDTDLVVFKLFVRGEVLSCGHTPDKRLLLEQRSGFEIWDPQTRRAVVRLALNTRQPPLEMGFLSDGRMIWALTSAMPMRVEVFRASDGLRFFELERPGRALTVESAPGRLVVAFEDEDVPSFLDFDVGLRVLRKVTLPEDTKQPLAFVVTQHAKYPELLLRLDGEEGSLCRLPLPRAAQTKTQTDARTVAGASGARSRTSNDESVPKPARSIREAREGRPETRLIRRLAEAETLRSGPRASSSDSPDSDETKTDGTTAEGNKTGGDRPDAGSQAAESRRSPVEAIGGAEPPEDGVSLLPTEPFLPEISLGGPVQNLEHTASAWSHKAAVAPLRAYDAHRNPASWQWELLRWAHAALSGQEAVSPPPAGPLSELALRLKLSAVGQKVLGLLYAAGMLLGTRPHGMRPLELARALSGSCEEPDVLAEVLPSSPLCALDLLCRRKDGRVMLRQEVLLRLSGTMDPDVQWPPTTSKETLKPGLYLLDGPAVAKPARLFSRPMLRLDGLAEPALPKVLPALLRRALLQDAAVSLDGFSGLSFPDFGGKSQVAVLHGLLQKLQVPVVLWAMADAPAAAGLFGRKLLDVSLVREGTAPALPSASLPPGVLFRPPGPASKAAVSPRATGQLQLPQQSDRRAVFAVGPSANAESYAKAAYLAARDGAMLLVDAELTPPRMALLALLLRQIPVVACATPPGGTDAAWPTELRPYVFT
ncbi:MAG TPA: hypothetical protein PKE31_14940 [Pseudomonadota bacterium]|nr:hypothetical protein [Pseudomonadota bacterium]